ncbi:MAG TPA: RbsD/FucU domain-containing protein [Fimbriimonadaceae bacterium]|nr:RbsD/FucU domain-containing protein [Fimbriimonadaceae bacterium]
MLRGNLLHPDILAALAGAGHGAKILVADANYPFSTHSQTDATIVYLNLAPGIVTVPQVVERIVEACPIESAAINVPASREESEVAREVRAILGPNIRVEALGRFEFYEAVRSPDLCLLVATGDTRIYSCALLTIGYIG